MEVRAGHGMLAKVSEPAENCLWSVGPRKAVSRPQSVIFALILSVSPKDKRKGDEKALIQATGVALHIFRLLVLF